MGFSIFSDGFEYERNAAQYKYYIGALTHSSTIYLFNILILITSKSIYNSRYAKQRRTQHVYHHLPFD